MMWIMMCTNRYKLIRSVSFIIWICDIIMSAVVSETSRTETLPVFTEHTLVHFRQRFDWDCGLSCILMLLGRNERSQFLANFGDICKTGGFGESTWTIDLCYILKDFGFSLKYLTTTFGANPSHVGKQYYKCFNADETRVNGKFENASVQNIPIEIKSVTNHYLIQHLANHGNIILLTNASLLHCDLCKANKLSMELRHCLGIKPTYSGHYIVLCGYDLRIHKFMYRNPAFKDKICFMSFESMDRARRASGTDEDIILIYDKKLWCLFFYSVNIDTCNKHGFRIMWLTRQELHHNEFINYYVLAMII